MGDWVTEDLRRLIEAIGEPQVALAMEEYDRLRCLGCAHADAMILAADLAGLDVGRIEDLRIKH